MGSVICQHISQYEGVVYNYSGIPIPNVTFVYFKCKNNYNIYNFDCDIMRCDRVSLGLV